MRNLFKIILISIALLTTSAVSRSDTFFLLPTSIQHEIIIFEQRKPVKPRMFYITPDIYWIFNDYLTDVQQDKYWWNKYRLTIHF